MKYLGINWATMHMQTRIAIELLVNRKKGKGTLFVFQLFFSYLFKCSRNIMFSTVAIWVPATPAVLDLRK